MKVKAIRHADCWQVFFQSLEAGFGSVFVNELSVQPTSNYVIIKGYGKRGSLVLLLTLRKEYYEGIEDRRIEEKEVVYE